MLEESTEAEAGIPLQPLVKLASKTKASSEPVESEKKKPSHFEADKHSEAVETERKKQRPTKKQADDSETRDELDEEENEDILVFKEAAAEETGKDDASQLRFKRERKCRLLCKFFRIITSCDLYLTNFCEWLAGRVYRFQPFFVMFPILCMMPMCIGYFWMQFAVDNDFLFTPIGSDGIMDREKIEKLFPTNYSAYVPGHETQFLKMVEVIVTAKNGGTVLRPDIWNEIYEVNEFMIKKLVITRGERNIRFEDVCAKYNGHCLQNSFLVLKDYMENIVDGKIKLTYPMMENPVNLNKFLLPMHMGGLTLVSSTSTKAKYEVEFAKALRLVYILDCSNKQKTELAAVWETGALEVLHQNITTDHTIIDAVNSQSIAKELVVNIHSALKYIHYAIGFVVAYTVANTYHPLDSSKIKIWIGLLGLINTVFATAGAWGLLSACGYHWQAINLASVFLLLGVGLDDTFVVLSAWRHTDSNDTVENRLKETYKEAAVSITITSLTNILSFFIGAIFPGFNCVQIFCMYTGVGIVFIYVFNLTFFGGCLAVAGDLEKRDLHGLVCMPKQKVTCIPEEEDDGDLLKGPSTFSECIFEHMLPNLLVKKWAKALIILIFMVYWALCIYWICHTQQGFERRKLARDDSYVVSYYDKEDAYFRQNPFRFQIVITEPLDYADEGVRKSIMDLMDRFKQSRFVSSMPEFEESWLQTFYDGMNRSSMELSKDLNALLSKENFMSGLKEMLVVAESTPLIHNIIFSEDKKSIVASRFFLQSAKSVDANDDMAMVQEMREIAKSAPFSTIVFNPYFTYIDLFIGVKPSTLMCLGVGTLIMLIVAVVLIPNPMASIWVIFTIISIEAGVIGFMYVWGINLDVISMICLIMCIGFSVDFSAHISYHFLASKEGSPDDRIRSSLKAFGTPIIQGASSTLLAVVVLAFLPSYVLQSFAKMLFLVITLGVVHGLLLLPVLLSLFSTCPCCPRCACCDSCKEAYYDEEEDEAIVVQKMIVNKNVH